ncbi:MULTISPECIES: TIGR02646 family protein [unclassified Pseudomonas]|uniref:TIGR02646 family protein n=1 Tax=unclassified Pseudomonas TaxID=196821 RepID=UPI002AC8DE08|nr:MULTISPECIES: TIGR02646 family protein [unclassified Pseudomonas]MEB0041142.1 TIGR02646 family protein [Pseudomonas sp. MH10]MEB0120326.1 TIGR02646 family protein [Pseudomonas sp. CCI1.2]WPX65617.1 TIGR02646 family protein [Pseudomonas sp. MH10]
MRKIVKGVETLELSAWKRANPGKRYQDLQGNKGVKGSIRKACVSEQFGLCAYCCQEVSSEEVSAHSEHVEAQARAPHRTLDFSNIVASCNRKKQCGDAHGSQILPLTPLMEECESELIFEMSGKVRGLTERAQTSIRVLNLGDTQDGNRGLIGARKAMVDALLYSYAVDPTELCLEDDRVLDLLLEDLLQPDAAQKLQPFSPVLVNVIRHLRL